MENRVMKEVVLLCGPGKSGINFKLYFKMLFIILEDVL